MVEILLPVTSARELLEQKNLGAGGEYGLREISLQLLITEYVE